MRLSLNDLNLLRPEYDATCRAARRIGWRVTFGLTAVLWVAIGGVYLWRGIPRNAIVDDSHECALISLAMAALIGAFVGWGIVTPLRARYMFKEGEELFDCCWGTIHNWLPMRVVRACALVTINILVPGTALILSKAHRVDDRVILAGAFSAPHSYAEITGLQLQAEAMGSQIVAKLVIQFSDGGVEIFQANRTGASVEAITDFVCKRTGVALQKSRMLP